MITGLIIAGAWLAGSVAAWHLGVKDWDNPKWENVALSLTWPCILPLWCIHRIHNGHW